MMIKVKERRKIQRRISQQTAQQKDCYRKRVSDLTVLQERKNMFRIMLFLINPMYQKRTEHDRGQRKSVFFVWMNSF